MLFSYCTSVILAYSSFGCLNPADWEKEAKNQQIACFSVGEVTEHTPRGLKRSRIIPQREPLAVCVVFINRPLA